MKKLIASALVLAFALAFAACVYDGPPKDDGTAEPDPHKGVFVSEHGKMTFSGDGKTVVIDFDEELAAVTGLPSGEHEAAYAFMANTPPHRYEYRWDRSNEFRITVGEASYVFGNLMGSTSADTIAIFAYTDGGTLDLVFERTGD